MSQITKCYKVTVVLTYWEASGEVSEQSYNSLLIISFKRSYCSCSTLPLSKITNNLPDVKSKWKIMKSNGRIQAGFICQKILNHCRLKCWPKMFLEAIKEVGLVGSEEANITKQAHYKELIFPQFLCTFSSEQIALVSKVEVVSIFWRQWWADHKNGPWWCFPLAFRFIAGKWELVKSETGGH